MQMVAPNLNTDQKCAELELRNILARPSSPDDSQPLPRATPRDLPAHPESRHASPEAGRLAQPANGCLYATRLTWCPPAVIRALWGAMLGGRVFGLVVRHGAIALGHQTRRQLGVLCQPLSRPLDGLQTKARRGVGPPRRFPILYHQLKNPVVEGQARR